MIEKLERYVALEAVNTGNTYMYHIHELISSWIRLPLALTQSMQPVVANGNRIAHPVHRKSLNQRQMVLCAAMRHLTV